MRSRKPFGIEILDENLSEQDLTNHSFNVGKEDEEVCQGLLAIPLRSIEKKTRHLNRRGRGYFKWKGLGMRVSTAEWLKAGAKGLPDTSSANYQLRAVRQII